MPRQEIAIIGGGAKAAAIAAKAYCLRDARVADIGITIFERHAIGAHWDGGHGYTDGLQSLCTPAFRDLGFPYDTSTYGTRVAIAMQGDFSWMAYTVLPRSDPQWHDWIDRGATPPTHAQFAGYLREAVAFSKTEVRIGEVTGLRYDDEWWNVTWRRAEGGMVVDSGFDGVVVTSPGPARRLSTLDDPRLMTGADFWTELPRVRSLLANDPTRTVVIIGGGGTAAAIVAWFVHNGFADQDIIIVANRPTLYTRTHNFFENRLFNDPETWATLSRKHRSAFNERLTQGVVWDAVTDELTRARNLRFRSGHVASVVLESALPRGTRAPARAAARDDRDLLVQFDPPAEGVADRQPDIPAALVVDASGFDNWWFTSLLDEHDAADCNTAHRPRLCADMEQDLSLPVDTMPGLHVPLVSGMVSPGSTSLMALGAMADRILRPYVLNGRKSDTV